MRRRVFVPLAATVAVLVVAAAVLPRIWKVQSVSGIVRDATKTPVAGATVRIKATGIVSGTDQSGRFHLTARSPGFRHRVTAWKDGYFVGGETAWPWDDDVVIELTAYSASDDTGYAWISPVASRPAVEEKLIRAGLDVSHMISAQHLFVPVAEPMGLGCADCHPSVVTEWSRGAHAVGSTNPRFLTMYNGTDVAGNRSPPRRSGYSPDYGSFPLRPSAGQPNFGPGYKLDFPETDGNCGACHLPTAAIKEPYGVNPNEVVGVDALGTHCDFCHKIASVRLDATTGRPYDNMPGILSIELARPSSTSQIFFGPYDDVDAGTDTYLPLMKRSEMCAPCHDASFWGVPIYESFGEWLASPYPAQGKTCQSCHMRPDGVTDNFAPRRGGVTRDPETVPTHHFPGAADTTLLQNAVTMEVGAERRSDVIAVSVSVTNDQTGHHVPTDSPLRQMILVVDVQDEYGQPLAQIGGPTVPEWGGLGEPNDGYYAGLAGKAFAKILTELWTNVTPTGAYWNPTRIESDNRIPAHGTDNSEYLFSAPLEGDIRIETTLLFRRAFIALMDQKGWDVPDVVMDRQTLILSESGAMP